MSRALGAAFLNHQVEQLEKTVVSNGASGNWRSRRQPGPPLNTYPQVTPKQSKRNLPVPLGMMESSRRDRDFPALSGRPQARERTGARTRHPQESPHVNGRRSSEEKEKTKEKGRDADVVVVDASVLVHALYQVKKWCRDGREEVIIIPLEGMDSQVRYMSLYSFLPRLALNTLDLLKKGTTSLAQRARAASRILEAQVGTNPRIRVQQDDAFILWDKINFDDALEHPEADCNSKHFGNTHSPEWVRRTISCARWEVEHANAPTSPAEANKKGSNLEQSNTNGHPHSEIATKGATSKPKVVLAILSAPPDLSPALQHSQTQLQPS